MTRALAISMLATVGLALAACNEGGEAESAQDYAARVGTTAAPAAPVAEGGAAMAQAGFSLPEGVDATQLQRLDDFAAADLGERTGGCTFLEMGREVFASAGNAQSGKGVIRVGGALVTLDAAGGIGAIRAGTSFTAPGVGISVAPAAGNAARREANMVVTDAAGVTQSYSGDWICG